MTPSHNIGAAITSSVDNTLRNTPADCVRRGDLPLRGFLAKVSSFGTEFLHVCPAGAAELTDGIRHVAPSDKLVGQFHWLAKAPGICRSTRTQGAGFHFFEANSQRAVDGSLCTA